MFERIGNCEIVEEIGSGGMATVYKAVQQPLGRTVAIKALKPSIAVESQFARRFEREAHFMASLQHENILHVHDFLKQQGSMFIVMEYIQGVDLYDLLERKQTLPVDVAAIVALQVARALDYAHFRGIVHRDVKPANIMISRHGEVKLMDFGIARDETMRDLTETGTGLGTPSYMSPEQILGDKLDFRSDIFSLGIVLYQMVTGAKPFVEDETHTVMQKIRLDRYTPPRKLNPKVSRQLEHIMARCMEKVPSNRYGSTQALIDDLVEFLSTCVPINHNARLVMFLREASFISNAEADEILEAAGSRASRKRGSDRSLIQDVAFSMAILLLGILISGGTIEALDGRFERDELDAAASRAGLLSPDKGGFLQVVVTPWAEVHVDGKHLATTPTAERFLLPPGRHYVKFVNPRYASLSREIRIEVGKTVRLTETFDGRPKGTRKVAGGGAR